MSFLNYLPAYILNHSPKIVAAFEMDFLRNLSSFSKAIPEKERFTMLLSLGWSAELPEVLADLKNRIADARKIFPEARFIFLANTPAEAANIREFCEVYTVNHNVFLDPRRYPVAKKKQKKFHALYIARITPFKRHFLAEKIENLHLIGDYAAKEEEYFKQVIARMPHAVWSRKVPAFFIGGKICESACGLALSAVEGAMFSCGEYSLCGIPVVNTVNLGGRDTLLPDFAFRYAEDNADSVAEKVEYFVHDPIDPMEIRDGFLRLVQPQKALVQDLVNSIAGKKVYLPHKLGIRCGLLPHIKFLHGIRATDR
ncbi:MAG: glycosyltransferase [Lentisphaeria bacterium]|nr:glycosyltransferase [Lentisphaeria bacterium]